MKNKIGDNYFPKTSDFLKRLGLYLLQIFKSLSYLILEDYGMHENHSYNYDCNYGDNRVLFA